MDVKLKCRACMESLSDNSVFLWNIDSVKNLFSKCSKMQFDDKFLPKYLCETCYKKCTAWKEFIKQCEKSQNRFVEMLIAKSIKEENETPIQPIEEIDVEMSEVVLEKGIPDPAIINVKKTGSNEQGKDIFKCKACKSVFFNSQSYESHYKTVHTKKPQPPVKPKKNIPNLPKLLVQIGPKMNLLQKQMFKCKECRQMFDNLTVYKIHYNNLHNFVCVVCKTKFKNAADCVQHQTIVHVVDFLPVTENISTVGESSGESVKKKEPDSFECKICAKYFASRTSLKVHSQTHVPVEERGNCCEYCGKSFSASHYLKTHIQLSHVLEANILCHLCPLKFKTHQKLEKHIKIHTMEKQIQCEFCPSKFKKRNTYINHRMIHTGERRYICKICNHGFIQHHPYKAHMMTH